MEIVMARISPAGNGLKISTCIQRFARQRLIIHISENNLLYWHLI
jgi:hypothetical protein